MKLISMIDFVLQEEKKGLQNTDMHLKFEKILKYAKFLKQPLKLEMFVPCDEYGNVLEPPKNYLIWLLKRKELNLKLPYNEKYYKASQKVLFYQFKNEYHSKTLALMYILEFNNIEQLSNEIRNIELTPNAIKQLGL